MWSQSNETKMWTHIRTNCCRHFCIMYICILTCAYSMWIKDHVNKICAYSCYTMLSYVAWVIMVTAQAQAFSSPKVTISARLLTSHHLRLLLYLQLHLGAISVSSLLQNNKQLPLSYGWSCQSHFTLPKLVKSDKLSGHKLTPDVNQRTLFYLCVCGRQ